MDIKFMDIKFMGIKFSVIKGSHTQKNSVWRCLFVWFEEKRSLSTLYTSCISPFICSVRGGCELVLCIHSKQKQRRHLLSIEYIEERRELYILALLSKYNQSLEK